MPLIAPGGREVLLFHAPKQVWTVGNVLLTTCVGGQLLTVFALQSQEKVYLGASESLQGCHFYNLEHYLRDEDEGLDCTKTIYPSVSQLLRL